MFIKQVSRTLSQARGTYLRSTFVRNVSSSFVLQVLVLFLAFANSAVMTRWLGPEQKGTLTLALLVPSVLGLFLGGGISIANVYFAGSRRLSVSGLSATSVTFVIVASLLGSVILGGLLSSGWLGKVLPGLAGWTLVIAMLMLPVGLASGYFSAIFQGLQRIAQVSRVNVVQSAVGFGLTVLLVAGLGLRMVGALLSTVVAGATGLVLLAAMLRQEGAAFRPRFDVALMRSMLVFGLKGHIGNVLQFFTYRLDLFVVNYYLGPAHVGIYSVAVMLAELLWQFPHAVAFVIFPKSTSTDPIIMNAFTPRVFRVTLGLTAATAMGLALVGKPFIHVIYSTTFADAYGPMLVLLPGVVLLGGGKVLTSEIAGRGYAHYNSINAALALMLTVVLDVLFIPQYGLVGAAAASSIAYTATCCTAIAFYRLVSRHVDGQRRHDS